MTAARALRFPVVGPQGLDENVAAHRRAAAIRSSLPGLLRETADAWLHERAVSSLAAIRPSWFAGTAPPLFPAPRGYLDEDQRHRVAGARTALAHVEARLRDHANGRRLVAPETPFVLNALAEGRRDPGPPSSPGLIRPVDTRWHVRDHPYNHPLAEDCPALLDATLEALESDHGCPPVVAGAWLAFSLLSIHPFGDGNGRTARLLYLLVSASAIPTGLDLGIAEQWVFHRHHYRRVLDQGQRVAPHFDVDRLDARPFAEATVAWSTDAAQLTSARLAALSRAWQELAGFEEAYRAAVLAASLHRFVTPDDLPVALGDYPARLDVLLRLVSAKRLARVLVPPSRVVPGALPRPHFAATTETARQLTRAVAGTG